MATGKCSKCEKTMPYVVLEHVEARVPFGATFHGTSFQCPYCRTVLSASLDQIAVKTDTVNAVLKAMGKPPLK